MSMSRSAYRSSIPRNYFLLVHDACRHVLGQEAQLAAFVKNKQPFQCDMVVRSSAFDPPDDVVLPARRLTMAPSSSSGMADAERRRQEREDAALVRDSQRAPAFVTEFGAALQAKLGICDVQARRRRLDIVFRDRQVMHVALSAKVDIKSGAEINSIGAWEKRNPLRIALGYDEELFQDACDMNINLAARSLEKDMHTQYSVSPVLELHAPLRDAYIASNSNWRAVSPPISYWQAHGYVLCRTYPCRHVEEVLSTVRHNFAKFYDRYPFANPYCEGEDLNTMDAARFACEVWSLQPSMAVMHKITPLASVQTDVSESSEGPSTAPPRGAGTESQ